MNSLSKKIAQNLETQHTYTWYLAGELTHGEANVMMVSVGDEEAGPFVIEQDDKFTGTPTQLVNYIKGKYPQVDTLVVDPTDLNYQGILDQLKNAAMQGGLMFDLDV